MATPSRYPQTYTDSIEDHLLVFHPYSPKGVVVLNREAAFIFNLINGQRSKQETFKLCQQEDPHFTKSKFGTIFRQFESDYLIYTNTPGLKAPVDRPPKTLGVWFHLTNQCNLRCTYCYVDKSAAKMDPQNAQKWLTKILVNAKLHDLDAVKIKFSGGEALLEEETLFKLISFLKTEGKRLDIKTSAVVLSNGVLISPKIARKLKQAQVAVMISLDGPARYHDQTRVFPGGGGTYRFVKQGIKNLQQAKVPFNVSITVTAKNVSGLPQLTKYVLTEKIPFTFNFFRENCFAGSELTSDDQKMVRYLKQAYHEVYLHPPKYPVIGALLDRVTFGQPHLFTCGVGRNYLIIDHLGNLSSCQMTLKESIGHIDDADPINVMQNRSFIPKGLTVDQKTPCQTCDWRYVCCGGCPLATFKNVGRYDTNNPYCAVYQALIPELLKLEAKRLLTYN